MKIIELGNKKIQVCEGLHDINYLRATIFKQYITQLLYNIDMSLFELAFNQYTEAINKGLHSQGLIVWHNFKQSLKLTKNKGVDAYGICFALITIEENENIQNFDETFLIEKLKRLSGAGLTRQTVEEEVLNFTKAFPQIYFILKSQMEGQLNINEIL
jgi:hypothetical protein